MPTENLFSSIASVEVYLCSVVVYNGFKLNARTRTRDMITFSRLFGNEAIEAAETGRIDPIDLFLNSENKWDSSYRVVHIPEARDIVKHEPRRVWCEISE